MTTFNLSATARDNQIEAERLAALHTSAREMAKHLRQHAISDAGNAMGALALRWVRALRWGRGTPKAVVLE